MLGRSHTKPVRFDTFVLDLTGEELFDNGRAVKLARQPFKVLKTLVLQPGEIVSREALRTAVWGEHTHVDFEGSLHSCIKQIRAALGDDASAPRYIETLPRRGYRFLPELCESAPRPRPRLRAALGLAGTALVAAALIATSRSSDPPPRAQSPVRLAVIAAPVGDETSYRSTALAEELTRSLSALDPSRLEVLAFTSASHPELPSRSVDVDYVVSLRAEADVDVIRVELEQRGVSRWRGEGKTLAALAAALVPRLLPEPVTPPLTEVPEDADAYDAYLKARYHLNRREHESLALAERYAREALSLAADFAPAHVALANVHIAERRYDEAARSAERALELAPSAEAHFALGLARWYGAWDWKGAGESFQRALLSNPGYARAHHWYAYYLTGLGRHEEAIQAIERASKLDPLSPEVQSDVGWFYYFAGRFDEAVTACERTLELEPGFRLAEACIYEARRALGDERDYQERSRDPYTAAVWHLREGDPEAALSSLAHAVEVKSAWVPMLAVDPRFDALRTRATSDYESLLEAAGFP